MTSFKTLERGEALYAIQRFKEAAEQFRLALAENPSLVRAHTMLALTLMKLGDAKASIEEASTAVALAPDDHYTNYIGAFINRRAKRFDASLSLITNALKLAPDCASYHAEMALCYLANTKRKSLTAGNGMRARQESDLAIKLAPSDASACRASAWVLYWTGYGEEADSVLDRALSADPEVDEAHWLKGKILLERKDFVGAFDHLKEALRLSPNSEEIKRDYMQAKTLLVNYPQFFGLISLVVVTAFVLVCLNELDPLVPRLKDYPSYRSYLDKHIEQQWFPDFNQDLTTVVQFTIHQDGQVSNIKVKKSSGNKVCDDAAISAVKSAAPYPPFPKKEAHPLSVDYTFEFYVHQPNITRASLNI